MFVITGHLLLAVERDRHRHRDCLVTLGIGRRTEGRPFEIGWRVLVEVSWNWLPPLRLRWRPHDGALGVVDSKAWTGRFWDEVEIRWRDWCLLHWSVIPASP